MSGKGQILVLDVDLDCHRCNKKINKVLDRYKDEWGIKTITCEARNNKVTLTGDFDAKKLKDKLCKKACEVIRGWSIKEPEKPKPADPPKPPKPADQPKPEAPKPKLEPPKPEPPKPEPKREPPKVEPPKPEPPKAEPPKPEPPKKPDPPKPEAPNPEPAKPAPAPPKPPACPEPPVGFPYPYPYPYPLPFYVPCDGHNKPCSCGGCCGGHRPCACGCGGGCSGPYQQPPPVYIDYGRPCHYVCEEETPGGCSIM